MIDRLATEVDMLVRHLTVFRYVYEHEPIGIVRLAEESGYPTHRVRYSLRILEEEGLIEPSPTGAVTTQSAEERLAEYRPEVAALVERVEEMKGIPSSS